MKLQWTSKAPSDLARLHAFLEPVNPRAAATTVQSLTQAAGRLQDHPRIGEQLDGYAPREVRRILADRYELRYEIQGSTVFVLRLWHTREQR